LHPTASERSACSLCPSGYWRCSRRQAPWRTFGSCTFWFAAGSSRETLGEGRAGCDGRSSARPGRRRGRGRRKNPAPPLHWYRPIKQARSYAPQSQGPELLRPGPESQRSRSSRNTTTITTATIISVRTIPHLLPRTGSPRCIVTERREPRRLGASEGRAGCDGRSSALPERRHGRGR
jgi:hypothetical protein